MTLKSDLQSNYQKYFKNSFANKDFKNKWKQWEGLRNKIAHSNLFTQQDLEMGRSVAAEIIEIIRSAKESTAQLEITQGEREAVQEQLIAKASSIPEPDENDFASDELPSLKKITDEEFLDELKKQESDYRTRRNGFVGLTRFVRFHLGELGFSSDSSYAAIERLKNARCIEVYYVDNPYQSETKTAALKTIESK